MLLDIRRLNQPLRFRSHMSSAFPQHIRSAASPPSIPPIHNNMSTSVLGPHPASSSHVQHHYPSTRAGHGSGNGDYQEIKSVCLEWKLDNLKHIFDSSRGETKSKCIKSSLFGDGRWEVYFYANSVSAQRVAVWNIPNIAVEGALKERGSCLTSFLPTATGNGPRLLVSVCRTDTGGEGTRSTSRSKESFQQLARQHGYPAVLCFILVTRVCRLQTASPEYAATSYTCRGESCQYHAVDARGILPLRL